MFTLDELNSTILKDIPFILKSFNNDISLPKSREEQNRLKIKSICYDSDNEVYVLYALCEDYKTYIGKKLRDIPLEWFVIIEDKNERQLTQSIYMDKLYRYTASIFDNCTIIKIMKNNNNDLYTITLNCEVKL